MSYLLACIAWFAGLIAIAYGVFALGHYLFN